MSNKLNIIGIGRVGCRIASYFKKFPKQYRVYSVDIEKHGSKSFMLPQQNTVEEYELSCPDLSSFFGKLKGLTYVFLSSGNRVSGAALKILEHLKGCRIVVVCVHNDEGGNRFSNLIFGVLQEYTRSGVFENIILVSNKNIEKAFDGIPIFGYYDTINDYVANLIDLHNYFTFNESVFSDESDEVKGARISTLSVVDLETGIENSLFDLDFVRVKKYAFGVSQKILESDKGLHNKIKEHVLKCEHGARVSYSVYVVAEGKNVAICMEKSPNIQLSK